MLRNPSDKTKLTIKYLKKLRAAEPLTEDESRELECLLSDLKTLCWQILILIGRLYKWHDFIMDTVQMLSGS